MKSLTFKFLTTASILLMPYTNAFAIAVEKAPDVAGRIFMKYQDPEIALRSYATVDSQGCSGTMIGPNTLMAAAHCSGAPKTINFRLYSPDTAEQSIESFNCTYLTHNFPDSDLILFDCPANVSGENPGDKYGYLDFDIRLDSRDTLRIGRDNLEVGSALYSVWTNPINSIGGQHMIYSEGTITNNEDGVWSNPDMSRPACGANARDMKIGIATNLWSNGGASGSSQISLNNHRLVLGPLSIGNTDTRGRNQMSILDYLVWGWAEQNVGTEGCRPSVRSTVNESYLSGLGVTDPTKYYGFMNKDSDGVFDVQQDIEQMRGETRRDWTWLGFESHRRNKLWTKTEGASISSADPVTGISKLKRGDDEGNFFKQILSHELLDLESGENYRMSFMFHMASESNSNAIQVCVNGCVEINVPKGVWVTRVHEFEAADDSALRFKMPKNTTGWLAAVSVIRNDAVMDFDSHDTRYNWRTVGTGERGLIVPEGRPEESSSPIRTNDWAGVVLHKKTTGSDTQSWSLRNKQLAIRGGYEYKICFNHRWSTRWQVNAGVEGTVRLTNKAGVIAGSSLVFSLGRNYQQQCTSWFNVPTDDNLLMFGAKGTQRYRTGGFYVDDITFQRRDR